MTIETYDFDDDYGDFEDMFAEDAEFNAPKPKSGARNVIEGAAGTIVGGVKDKFLDEDFQKEIIGKALPPGYNTIYDGLKTVKGGIADVYDEARKGVKKVSNAIKKTTRQFMPKIRGNAPKGIADKIENWAGKERQEYHQWNDSEKDRRDAQMQATLGSIFGEVMEKQTRDEDARNAQTELTNLQKDMVTNAYSKDLNTGIDSLVRMATKRDSYHDAVGIKVQRKTIELLTRQTMLQVRLNDTLTKFMEMSDNRLTNIQTNTAMPEFVKLHDSERVKQIMADRVYGKVTEKFSGKISDVIGKVAGKAKEKISSVAEQTAKMLELGGQVAGGTGEGDFEREQAEMEFEAENGRPMNDDEKKKFEKAQRAKGLGAMMGGQAVDPIAMYLADLITAKVKKGTDGNENVKRIGLAGKNIMDNSGGYLQEAISRINQMPVLGALMRGLDIDTLRDDGQKSLIKRSGAAFLEERALWTNRENKSLNVIIPGWLAKIHNEIKMHRTGKDSTAEVFSLERDTFVSSEEHVARVKGKVIDESAIARSGERLNALYKTIDPDKVLSPKAQSAIKEHLTKLARKGTGTVNMRDMVGDKSPLEDPEVLEEVRKFFEEKWGIKSSNSKKEKTELKDLNLRWGPKRDENDDRISAYSREGMQLAARAKRLGEDLHNNEMAGALRDDFGLDSKTQEAIAEQRRAMESFKSTMGGDYAATLQSAKEENVQFLVELGILKEYPPGSGNYHQNFDMINKMITDKASGKNDEEVVPPEDPTPAPTADGGPPTPPPNSRVRRPPKKRAVKRRTQTGSGPRPPPVPKDDDDTTEITRYHTGGIVGEMPDSPFPSLSVKGIGAKLDALQKKLMSKKEMLTVLKVDEEVLTKDDPRHRKNQGKLETTPEQSMMQSLDAMLQLMQKQHLEKAEQATSSTASLMEYMDDITQLLTAANMPKGEDYDSLRAVTAGSAMSKHGKWKQRWSGAKSKASNVVKMTGKVIGAPFKLGYWATKKNLQMIGGAGKLLGSAVGGLTGGLLGSLTESKTEIGEKHDEMQADVFVKGRRKPALRGLLLAGGEYFDAKSGKVIKTLGEIRGQVVDSKGNVVLTDEEFEKGLFIKEKSAMVKIGRGIGAVAKGIFNLNMLPFKVLGMMGKGAASMWRGLKSTINYVDDIYVQGETMPRVLSSVFNNGGYLQLNGKPARVLKDIIGGLMTADGTVILSHADIAKGLTYKNGKEVKIGNVAVRMIRAGVKGIGAAIGITTKLAIAGIKLPFRIMGGAAKLLTKGLNGVFGKDEKKQQFDAKVAIYQTDLLESINKVLQQRLPGGDGDKVTSGSLADLMSRKKAVKPSDTIVNVNVEGGKEKGKGFLGWLMAAFGSVLGMLKGLKDSAVGWLKKIALGKAVGGALGGGGGNCCCPDNGGRQDRRRGRNGRNGRNGRRDRNGRNGPRPGANPPPRPRPGPAPRGGSGRLALLAGALYAGSTFLGGDEEEEDIDAEEEGAEDGGLNPAVPAAAALGGMTAAQLAGTPGTVTRAAGDAVQGQAGSLGDLGKDIAGTVGATVAGGVAEQLLFNPAARVVAGQAVRSGAMWAIGAAAGLLSAPVLIGAAAVAAVAIGGYMLYKYLDARKYPVLNFRLAQYGFDPGGKQPEKLLELEKTLAPSIRYVEGKATISKGVAVDKVYAIFSVSKDDQKQVAKFGTWFNKRFLPVYLGWLTVLQGLDKTCSLQDVDTKLDVQKKLDLMRESHITGGNTENPYVTMLNPFSGEDVLDVNKAVVEQRYEKLYLDLKGKLSKSNAVDNVAKASTAKSEGEKASDRQQKIEDTKTMSEKAAENNAQTPGIMSKVGSSIWETAKATMFGGTLGMVSNAFGNVKNLWNAATGNNTAESAATTTGELSKSAPQSTEQHEQNILNAAIKYGITDPTELRMFMAQCAQETGWFKHLKELGGPNYWKMYEGRRDLGNTSPGDGVKYPGRGYIQMTGKGHYVNFAKASGLDVVNNPDIISNDPKIAAEASAWWWTNAAHKSIRRHAAAGNVEGTTKIINGGRNGLADRHVKYKHYIAKYGKMSTDDMLKAIGSKLGTGAGAAVPSGTPTSGSPPVVAAKGAANALAPGTSADAAAATGKTGTSPSPVVMKPGGGTTPVGGAKSTAPAAAAAATPSTAAPATGNAPWMTVAEKEIGINENANNDRVTQYHSVGSPGNGYTGKVAWCASFVGWCLAQVGLKGTNSALASSYSKWGQQLDKSKALPYGAIIVVSVPGKTASGTHVFFCAGEEGGRIKSVGGNQGGGKRSGHDGGVTRSSFPRKDLLSATWPTGTASPAPSGPGGGTGASGSTPGATNTVNKPREILVPLKPGERRLVGGGIIPAPAGKNLAAENPDKAVADKAPVTSLAPTATALAKPSIAAPNTSTVDTSVVDAKARAARALKEREDANRATNVVTPTATAAQTKQSDNVNLQRRQRADEAFLAKATDSQNAMVKEQQSTNAKLDQILKVMLEGIAGSRQNQEAAKAEMAAKEASASNQGSSSAGGTLFSRPPVDFSK